MSGTLETATRQLFKALDDKDIDSLLSASAADIQAVDEISRRWLRGIGPLGSYYREAIGMIGRIDSKVGDVRETVHGDTGFVTCWLEQDYELNGKPTHVSAPTTLGFRRDGDAWKIVLIHTVPLPPEQT